MITQDRISDVLDAQNTDFQLFNNTIEREALAQIPIVNNFATIITGIRRCGKSTVMQQLREKRFTESLYCNFEDIRLSSFDKSDFVRLYNEIVRREVKTLFFDEVQLIEGWDIFVHQLLREHFEVFVTGSNASLLSRELGTHLTGRHLSMELFPFSYNEFLQYRSMTADVNSLKEYIEVGGVPDYVKSGVKLVINTMVDDILVRDIVVRHSIKDVTSLKKLTLYLLSNVGKPVSANKLVDLFGLKAPSTILEYFSHLSDAYLMEFVPQFNYSVKAVNRNPKKVYAIDTGIVSALSLSHTKDSGRLLENLVYLHFRRNHRNIHYYNDSGECDFVISENTHISGAVQVCEEVNDMNMDREINGLLAALNAFNLPSGTIVTLSQSDHFEKNGKSIQLIPAHEFLTAHDLDTIL